MRIVITGSEGLVGERLRLRCESLGFDVVGIDVVNYDRGAPADIRSPGQWAPRLGPVDGIVHLAAVSRVAWGERHPFWCTDVNERGTRSIIDYATSVPNGPWLLFASSREVYGNPSSMRISEDEKLEPVNVYGRSKLAGELMVDQARKTGLVGATVRLSNVYGGPRDHPDRAVPALVNCAILNRPITLTGSNHFFDFVHVDDVVSALVQLMHILDANERSLPPIHLVTGRATTLKELALQSIAVAGSTSSIEDVGPRGFDVSGFCGDPARAERLLGWRAKIALAEGLARLVSDMRRDGPPPPVRITI